MAKLLFTGSKHAGVYAKYRPSYPKDVIEKVVDFMSKKTPGPFEQAVDVGCGSGQSTGQLASHFNRVLGVDVSEAQIAEACKNNAFKNVEFKASPAEVIPSETSSVNLVTVAQAMHWFDIEKFYKEVDRILLPGGVLAAYMYWYPVIHYPGCSDELNEAFMTVFYKTLTDTGCWNKGRLHIENKYTDFELPYEDRVRDSSLSIEVDFTIDQFMGYLSSWSAYQTYIKKFPDDNQILERVKQTLLAIVAKHTTEKNVVFHISYEITLLMGRKPCSKSEGRGKLPVKTV